MKVMSGFLIITIILLTVCCIQLNKKNERNHQTILEMNQTLKLKEAIMGDMADFIYECYSHSSADCDKRRAELLFE